MTLKESLDAIFAKLGVTDHEAAINQISTLQGDAGKSTQASTDLASAQGQVSTLTAERDQARTELSAEQGKVASLNAQVATLTTERDQLKATQKDVGQAAAEQLASRGLAPAAAPGASSPEAKDLKATWEAYIKVDGREATEFWNKHQADLEEYARTAK